MPPDRDKELELNYIRAVGHPPRNLPPEHPDRWQWEYGGTKVEREGLLERLGQAELPPADQPALF